MNYQGKSVVVTGASGGLGVPLCQAFAERGAVVLAGDINPFPGTHPNIHHHELDLESNQSIEAFFKWVQGHSERIHILINNGAIASFHKPLTEMTPEAFNRVIQVNLCGAFACALQFIKMNHGESYGRILNIASTRWAQNEPGWDAYGASKGGLVGLTQSMAVSLSDTPITVNAISPGWIETKNYDELTPVDHGQHPSGRVGKPSDIVAAAFYLTDEANDFVNGTNLVVDGGMTKRMIYAESE